MCTLQAHYYSKVSSTPKSPDTAYSLKRESIALRPLRATVMLPKVARANSGDRSAFRHCRMANQLRVLVATFGDPELGGCRKKYAAAATMHTGSAR